MSEKKTARGGRAIIIAAALLWGLAGVCVKSVTWGPLPLVGARSLLSFGVLLAFRGNLRLRFTKTNVLAALFTTATGLLYVVAIKLTTAGSAIVLQYIAPILVFLYAVLFQGRKARPVEIVLTLCVFAGIVLSFADSLDPSRVAGNALALLSGVTFAGQIIVMSGSESDSSDCLMISCMLSFLIALPFLLFDKSVAFTRTNVLWIVLLGVFQYGMGNALFGIGCKRVEAVESSLLLTLEPIFNPIPVAIFYGEMMGSKAIIGAAIVIISVAVYAVIGKKREA